MAINKAMRAALKALSYIDIDVQKNYKLERQVENIRGGLRPRISGKRKKPYVTWDHKVISQGHLIPVRLFMKPGAVNRPVLLFFHGGGWVSGNIDSYDSVCTDMARLTGHTVVSVDYRLAPEHKFPQGLNDCYAVWEALLCEIDSFGISKEAITLIGDSAGGNLAAAVSLMAKDKGGIVPARQILIYPSAGNDHSETSSFPSIIENGTDYLLTSKRLSDYMALYRSSDADNDNPYLAPLLAEDVSGQPRTLIITAEFCPLRDEGEAYGEKLKAAGNDVTIYRMKDGLHGYMSLPSRFVHVRKTYEVINVFLKK